VMDKQGKPDEVHQMRRKGGILSPQKALPRYSEGRVLTSLRDG
jgi:hypothetical protein